MSRPKASRALSKSTLVFLLLFASVQSGQLEEPGAVIPFGQVDHNVANQLLRVPAFFWMNEEDNGQDLEQNKTSQFTCEEAGVFPKAGSCKNFYYCETSEGTERNLSAFELTCPQTLVFDSETKTCIPLSNSTRPECRGPAELNNTEATDVRRNGDFQNSRTLSDETPAVNVTSCNEQISERLGESSREACASTGDIDIYIKKVKVVQPLELRSFDQEEYEAIIRNYNSDLILAQSNYDEWRHGNSVFSAIRETFLTAKNFEPTFNTKFEENQVRVKELTSEETPDIKQMEEDIASLKAEIEEVQKVLSTLEDAPSTQSPLDFLKDRLKNKEQELQLLVSDDLRVKTEKEVAALIDFLELVRLTVVDIQQNATETATRVETFQQKIVTDSNIFLRHREMAQNGIKSMQDQRKNNEIEKERILAEKRNLESGIQQDHNEISRITGLIHSAENEIRELEHSISNMQRKTKKRKRFGRILMVVPVAGWAAGGILLSNVRKAERRIREARDSINFYHNTISVHHSQIASKTREIQMAQNRISTLTANSQRLDEELSSFNKLDQDLADIQTDINSILPSVNKALMSVAKMKAVFDDIRQDLDSTLQIAKSGKENAEKKNLIYFIYNNISELKCKWNQANVKIVALDQCN